MYNTYLMKTRITFFTIAILAILTVSCTKQQYTCICYGGWGGEYAYVYKKSTSEKAKRQCESYNDGPGVYDGTFGCHLEN